MSTLKPGPELDRLVCEKVLGWGCGVIGGQLRTNGLGPEHVNDLWCGTPRFAPSVSIADAWSVVARLGQLCAAWRGGDGFFSLDYAEDACHGNQKAECDPVPHMTDDEVEAIEETGAADPQPWSCHFHIGCMGADPPTPYPSCWDHGKRFCARGQTAAHAICLAALLAVGVNPVR